MNRSKLILEYIHDRRAGVLDPYEVPDATTFIDLSHLESDAGPARDDTSSTPPAASVGVRQPARGSATSYRSWAPVPELGGRIVTGESLIESNIRDIVLGLPDVVEVRDQWPRVGFVDRHGHSRHHVFDYCVRYRSGRVEAIAVKPEEAIKHPRRDTRTSLFEDIESIRRQGAHLAFAHEVSILSDENVSPGQEYNADRLREARRYRHAPDVAEARAAIVSAAKDRFRLHDILKDAPDRWRREQAVWSLIDEGFLRAETNEAVIDRSWLRVARSCAEGAR